MGVPEIIINEESGQFVKYPELLFPFSATWTRLKDFDLE
jgi:hypothetical protein